jgi:hypothetical protein
MTDGLKSVRLSSLTESRGVRLESLTYRPAT